MIILEKKLPDNCEIILHGDTHIGSSMVHYKALDSIVEKVKKSKNVFWVHMGDWIEAIMPDDKRYQYDATLDPRPMRQVESVVDIYKDISSKGIVGLMGNHEGKLHSFGDLSRDICMRLGIPYGTWTAKVKMCFSRGKSIKFFLTHGFRGAMSSNAKDFEQQQANMKAQIKRRLSQKSSDCLIMAMGHTHRCLICPPSERLILSDDGKSIKQKYLSSGDGSADYIEPDCRWYLNTGSFFKTYELGVSGYAERAGYDPVELGYISVKINKGDVFSVDRVLI